MQNVYIIAVGRLKERFLREAFDEYKKRLTPFCRLNLVEIDEHRLPDNPGGADIQSGIEKEGERILKKIPGGGFVVSLCIEGEQLSSEKFSEMIEQSGVSGYSDLVFIIGGSFGLSDRIKSISKRKISFSKMTFPHQLFRIMLTEQIYRGYQIAIGGKYHK